MHSRVTPCCCERGAKAVYLGFAYDDEDCKTPEWHVTHFKTDSIDREDDPYPPASYCPYCGKSLPTLVKRTPELPRIRVVTDGGYYCDTCHDRLNNCLCVPEAWRWATNEGRDLSRTLTDQDFKRILQSASKNTEAIIVAATNDDKYEKPCGCFNCLSLFSADDVKKFDGATALCPNCEKRTVLAKCHGWDIGILVLAAARERQL